MKVVRQKPNTNIINDSGLSVYTFFLAVCLLLAPSLHAVEFSAIQLFSGFNEPLHAEIEVSGLVDPGAPVIVDVASPLEHQNYDVSLQYFNAAINTAWQQRADGRRIIRLTSELPVSLENLDFLLMAIAADETIFMRVQIPIKRNEYSEQAIKPQLWVQNISNKATDNLPLTRFNEPLPQRKKKRIRNKQKIVATKRLNRLNSTSELARANRQADANARVLAFSSAADEITYTPHFSKLAIAAVLNDEMDADKKAISAQPELVIRPKTENKQSKEKEKHADKDDSIRLAISDSLINKFNQLLATQSDQSVSTVVLLESLLRLRSHPALEDQPQDERKEPHLTVAMASVSADKNRVIAGRFDSITITPLLSRSPILSPVGFSYLFHVLTKQQVWIKSLQKRHLLRSKYSINTER